MPGGENEGGIWANEAGMADKEGSGCEVRCVGERFPGQRTYISVLVLWGRFIPLLLRDKEPV